MLLSAESITINELTWTKNTLMLCKQLILRTYERRLSAHFTVISSIFATQSSHRFIPTQTSKSFSASSFRPIENLTNNFCGIFQREQNLYVSFFNNTTRKALKLFAHITILKFMVIEYTDSSNKSSIF